MPARLAEGQPGITVKISQYAVDDFTKLTAGFVPGAAPDAFQNRLLGVVIPQSHLLVGRVVPAATRRPGWN